MKISEILKKYKDIEIDNDKVEELKSYLGIEECEFKIGDKYCYVINDEVYNTFWTNDEYDNRLQLLGNCFKTEQEALNKVEYLKIQAELERFASKYNKEEIDWDCGCQQKCSIYYNHATDTISYNYHWSCQNNGVVYFDSEELCIKAIKIIGEDRLKKYYFGVEE